MKKGRVKIVLLAAFGLLLLFPIYILFMSTFKTASELFVVSLWPKSPTFDNLKAVLNSEFLNSIKNSLFVSTTVTVVAMILHSLCGYALARLDFPGKRWIFGTIVSTLMIPTTTILVPLFISAFRRADELATAMECRCYHGGEGRTKLRVLRYEARDYVALTAGAVILAAVIVMRNLGI